jgi:hypothetical protein
LDLGSGDVTGLPRLLDLRSGFLDAGKGAIDGGSVDTETLRCLRFKWDRSKCARRTFGPILLRFLGGVIPTHLRPPVFPFVGLPPPHQRLGELEFAEGPASVVLLENDQDGVDRTE